MLCEKCGNREATTYFRQTVNGKVTEYRLCDDCAAGVGGASMFGGVDLGYFLGNMFQTSGAKAPVRSDVTRCEGCGLSYSEIAKRGKIGCAHCYDVFRDQLKPSIENIHGRAGHVGKVPKNFATTQKNKTEDKLPDETAQLKKELDQAIEEQEFEKAAVLRDRIRKAQGGDR